MNGDKNKIDIMVFLKEPSVKVAIIIAIVAILLTYSTQAYWKDAGIKLIYKEYPAEKLLSPEGFVNVPDGVFIISGNYSHIAEWVNTSQVNCKKDTNVKLVVFSKKDTGNFKSVIAIASVEGCSK